MSGKKHIIFCVHHNIGEIKTRNGKPAHRAECSWFLLEQDIRSVKRILTNGKYSVPLKWFLDVKWEHFCISLGIILPLIAPEREFDARWNSAINLILIKRFFYIFFGFKWQLQNISLKNLLYTSLGIGNCFSILTGIQIQQGHLIKLHYNKSFGRQHREIKSMSVPLLYRNTKICKQFLGDIITSIKLE